MGVQAWSLATSSARHAQQLLPQHPRHGNSNLVELLLLMVQLLQLLPPWSAALVVMALPQHTTWVVQQQRPCRHGVLWQVPKQQLPPHQQHSSLGLETMLPQRPHQQHSWQQHRPTRLLTLPRLRGRRC